MPPFLQSLNQRKTCPTGSKNQCKGAGLPPPCWVSRGEDRGNCAKGHSVLGQHVPALKSESCQQPGKKNAVGCSIYWASDELWALACTAAAHSREGHPRQRHSLVATAAPLGTCDCRTAKPQSTQQLHRCAQVPCCLASITKLHQGE